MPRPKLKREDRRSEHVFVTLRKDEKRFLRDLARRAKASTSSLVREALLVYMQAQGFKVKED